MVYSTDACTWCVIWSRGVNCGLMMPYALLLQAITRTNVDLLSIRSRDIHHFTRYTSVINQQNLLGNYLFEISFKSPRVQGVKHIKALRADKKVIIYVCNFQLLLERLVWTNDVNASGQNKQLATVHKYVISVVTTHAVSVVGSWVKLALVANWFGWR